VSRIPRPLARRLDRLAWRAHLFHRYAHHPLCREYASELIPLGRRTRLCRGCTYVALGLSVGTLLGSFVALPPLAALMIAVGGSAGSLIRGDKLRKRLLPAFALGLAFTGGVWWTSLVAVGLFTASWLLYRRRKPDRTPCLTCPERTRPEPCRGVRPIVRRERAYRRMITKMLDRAGV
jgi:hypothetical protein